MVFPIFCRFHANFYCPPPNGTAEMSEMWAWIQMNSWFDFVKPEMSVSLWYYLVSPRLLSIHSPSTHRWAEIHSLAGVMRLINSPSSPEQTEPPLIFHPISSGTIIIIIHLFVASPDFTRTFHRQAGIRPMTMMVFRRDRLAVYDNVLVSHHKLISSPQALSNSTLRPE